MEKFEHRIYSDNIRFRYAGGKTLEPGREFHPHHEIIFFEKGEAELISEDMHVSLMPNTVITVPKETYHQVLIKGDAENYKRCTLQFVESPQTKALTERAMQRLSLLKPTSSVSYLVEKLKGAVGSDTAPLILNSAFVLLLDEIATAEALTDSYGAVSDTVHLAIKYVNDNLEQPLTVAAVAEMCRVSESSLSHTFKKEMNIPLYRYILKKRLIHAHRKISEGLPLCTAALECGFGDYSGFYKQYKKMFGVSPSQSFDNVNKCSQNKAIYKESKKIYENRNQ